jgi:hypothetical protein
VFGPGRLADLQARYNRQAVEDHDQLMRAYQSAKGKRKREVKSVLDERYGDSPPRSLRPTSPLWKGYAQRQEAALMPEATGSHFAADVLVLRQIDPQEKHGMQRFGHSAHWV